MELGKTIEELGEMPAEEYDEWLAFLILRSENEQEEMRKAKNRKGK